MKAALVTGANTGIGQAIAERLLAHGFAVALATRAQDDETRLSIEPLAERGRTTWLAGDLADPAVPHRLVAEAVAALDRLDALDNNAGLSTAGPALELTAEDFDGLFAVDVRAAFLLAQEAARRMIAQGGGGAVANIMSVHETTPRPGFALYAAAKAALGETSRRPRSDRRFRSAAPAGRTRSRRSYRGCSPTKRRMCPARATSSTAGWRSR